MSVRLRNESREIFHLSFDISHLSFELRLLPVTRTFRRHGSK
jgi:hypothetical protein